MAQLSFAYGLLFMTSGVSRAIEQNYRFGEFVHNSIKRHLNCDFGEIDPEDKGYNEQAIIHGSRIFSVYVSNLNKENDPNKIWIITEADRSSTTVLFPNEY